MKYKWLNRNGNREIIIFFNGWGMDENVVSHLQCDKYDVITFFDYNNLDTDFEFEELEKYSKKYLISWSMGVMVASLFNLSVDKSIAINGTLTPIDDNYGIPEKIYDLTEKGLTEASIKKFVSKMFLTSDMRFSCNRSFESRKNELSALKKYQSNKDFKYDDVYISSYDKIIPTQNQVAFWNKEPNLKSGHCPFFEFSSWEELV